MAEPIFTFKTKEFIADYKNALDQFISDLNHVLQIYRHHQNPTEQQLNLQHLAKQILRLEDKTKILLSAPLDEELQYNIELIKGIIEQKVFSMENRKKISLHDSCKEFLENNQSIEQLHLLMMNYVHFPAEANRLVEELDHISHEFYDYLRL